MCTVAILNAGIDRVVIAAPDPLAGTLDATRLSRLPEIWVRIAKRLDVVWTQSDSPWDTVSYLSTALRDDLIDTFLDSRNGME